LIQTWLTATGSGLKKVNKKNKKNWFYVEGSNFYLDKI
jgi:hypothetical protein